MRLWLGVGAAAVVVVLLVGCGGGGGSESAAVRSGRPEASSPGAPAPQHELTIGIAEWEGPFVVGIRMAETHEFFSQKGLAVQMLVAASPVSLMEYVLGGGDDIAVLPETQAILAREKGAPIVVLGSLVSRLEPAMIWLRESDLREVSDLKGRSVAFRGFPSEKALLERLLAGADLKPSEVKIKSPGAHLEGALARGRVDAVFGGTESIEGAELRAKGLQPVVVKPADLGIPTEEELVLVARVDRVAKEPAVFRSFMAALSRGTAAAADNPQEAVLEIEGAGESNPWSNQRTTAAAVTATLPLLSRTGRASPGRAARLIDWMFREGMIHRKLSPSELLQSEKGD